MHELAAKIRDNLDALTGEYERLLLGIAGYTDMPEQARREAARNAIQLAAAGLETGNQAQFVQYVQAVAVARVEQGLEVDSVQQALTALVGVIEPLIVTVKAASFLWGGVVQMQAALSQMMMERVRESEERFRSVVEYSRAGIFIMDETYQFIYVNDELGKILGYTPDELIGMDFRQVLDEESRQIVAARYVSRQKGDEVPSRYEFNLLRKDGEKRRVEISSSVTRDAAGKARTVAQIWDITERRKAEEESRQLSRALEATHDGVVITDTDGCIRFVNRAFENMTGYRQAEALGQNPRILKSGLHSDEMYAEMWQAITSGQVWRGEMTNRRKDGTLYEAQLTISPVRDTAGEVESFVAIQRDITARKQVEQALEEQQAFLRQVIDINPNFIFVRDREGRFVLINRAMAEVYGTTVDDLIGKTDADFNPNLEESERFLREDRQVMDSLQDKIVPEEIVAGVAGDERWFQTIKRPLVDEDGVARRVLGVSTDITDHKRLESEMRASLERRARQVQTGTEIAQEIAAAPALDELFRRVVTLIKERFDYYHAQIFRYEPALDAVVLVVGYGETGVEMLAEGHRLVMGRGVVGTAAVTGQPVLAADVTQDEDWVPNPHLPETKGELAVPIKLGDQVLGILDVQSETAGALTEEDQLLLEGLCGQIAIAIQNTRLRQEMEESLHELERLTSAMSREGWEALRREAGPTGYLFDQTDVIPAGDFWVPEIGLAVERGALVLPTSDDRPAAVAPLSARGEIIGVMGVQDDPQRPLSSDDLALIESVAEQVAESLEDARLFEQTQTALAEAEVLYRISVALGAAQDYEAVLDALRAHTVLGRDAHNISLNFFDRPWVGDDMPEWSIPLARWSTLPSDAVSPRYSLRTFSAAALLRPDAPTIVADVETDPRLDDATRALYSQRFQAQSTIFVPLVVAGQWIGYVNAIYGAHTRFSEAQARRLMGIAGQAAVVVQNLRQLEMAQIGARHEQALREIAATVSASENLAASLPAIAEHLRQLVPLDVLTLATYTPGELEYTLLALGAETETGHFAQPGVRLPVEGTGPGWVIAHREPWLEEDIRKEMRFSEDDQLVAEGLVSRVLLPLLVGERVVGALNLASTQPGAFTQAHLSLLRQVAGQIAQALERVRLLQETRSALAEAEATHRAYLRRSWRDYLRQQETLRRGAFLYDRTEGAAVLDGLTEPVADLWLPEMERALSTGVSAASGDGGDEGQRTGLAIPIVLRGQTIGVLGVEDPVGEHHWSEDDRAVIEAVSRQLAQALENARLLGETQLRAQRERIIGDITGKVRASMDLESILQTTVRELGVALGTDRAFIRLGANVKLSEE